MIHIAYYRFPRTSAIRPPHLSTSIIRIFNNAYLHYTYITLHAYYPLLFVSIYLDYTRYLFCLTKCAYTHTHIHTKRATKASNSLVQSLIDRSDKSPSLDSLPVYRARLFTG